MKFNGICIRRGMREVNLVGVDLFWDFFFNLKFLKDGGWLGGRGSVILENYCIFILKKKFEDFCMFIFCLFVLNIYMDVEVYYKYNLKVFRWGMLKLI